MSDSDEVERSREALAADDLAAVRKIELVKKLIEHRKDRRVGEILAKLVASEEDPEVLKTAVLGLGLLGDRAHVKTLMPLLEHPRMRVTAAAIKALVQLDPNLEVQTLHPLLASRDDKARTAAVLALMSHDARLGTEMIEQLATSPTDSLRTTAARCMEALELSRAHALLVKMFIAEPRRSVVAEILVAVSKRKLSREGVEELNQYRAKLRAAKSTSETEAAKLKVLDKLMRQTYEEMDFSAGTIGMLEGQVDRLASSLEVKAADMERREEDRRRTGQQRRITERAAAMKAGPRWGRLAAGLVAVIALAAGAKIAWKPEPAAPSIAPAKVEIASVLGKSGERVSIEGKVLHVYRAQRSIALMSTGRVMICAVFAELPKMALQNGAKVKLEGVIRNVSAEHSLTIAGEKLDPAS